MRLQASAPFFLRARHGWVDERGFARASSGAPLAIEDGCGRFKGLLKNGSGSASNPRIVRIEGTVVALTSKWSYKFFHWTIEALPRLAVVHTALLQGARLLTSCKGSTAKNSLPLIGVSERQVVCWRPGRVYTSSGDLLWPESSPCGGAMRPAALILRRSSLLPPFRPLPQPALPGARDTVLLYRRHTTRRLVNHAAVQLLLSQAFSGIALRVVDGSETLQVQVGLYKKARCQVGPHGAGLALMMFAPDTFATAEVTPGSYFVTIKGKAGESPGAGNLHLNRNRNRTGRGVSDPQPNACYRGLAATLSQRHVWLLISGATANDDLAAEAPAVMSLAREICK